MIRTVDLTTGALSPAPYEAHSLNDAIENEPAGGVYAAFATWFGGKVVRLTHHLDRLLDSAQRVGIDLALDRKPFVHALGSMLEESAYGEAKVRISIAPPPPGLGVQHEATVAMEPFGGPPREAKAFGVRCSLVEHTRTEDPRAKRTDWIKRRREFESADGIAERLLVRKDGAILEGASSNFYAIDRDGSLITAAEGILFGTSRAIVLYVAANLVAVRLEPPAVGSLPEYAECFLSSASRGIVPIVAIEEQHIGDGYPGKMTRLLMAAYDEEAESMAEPLLPPVA